MSISPLQCLSAQLLRCDGVTLPPDLLKALNVIAAKTNDLINERAGEFLHRLDNKKHSEKEVQTVIEVFPQVISYTLGEGDILPIHSAATYCPDNAMSFIPLLAREGNIRNVGGEGKRGGLLSIVPSSSYSNNLIQLLANISKPRDPVGSDLLCLQTLQSLKDIGLLHKDDIDKYNLLFNVNHPSKRARFEFFAQWDPEMLRIAKAPDGVPFIHDVLRLTSDNQNEKDRFEMVFKTCVEHFPNELGMLFQEYKGVTACEAAFHLFGSKETMEIIRKYILPSHNYPILHCVMKHTPQFINIFTRHYFNATYMRDSNNRTLFVATLASGNMSFRSNAVFFSTCSDEQVGEKDPITGLFPFALAASGDICDLDAVYTLLRRVPGLIQELNVCTEKMHHPSIYKE